MAIRGDPSDPSDPYSPPLSQALVTGMAPRGPPQQKERPTSVAVFVQQYDNCALRDDLHLLPHLLHVLLEEVLLDVVHVELTALNVRLKNVAPRVDRRTGRDQERSLLAGLE